MASSEFHIVVVDDEQAVDMLFKAFFDTEISSKKVRITYVDLAKKCLKLIEAEKVDLILSDINMPQMNGFEFLAELRSKGHDIPVFMISAYGSAQYVNKAKELGAQEFFVKPFDFALIKQKVEQLTQG